MSDESNAVPDNWKKGVLEDLAEINPALKQRADLRDETPVSFIKMEDVSNNASIKNVRTVPYKQVSKGFTKFQDHDVLLAKITPCFENGKGGYVTHLQGGVGFGSTEFHVLRAKDSSDSRFIYQYTNYSAFRMEGEANMTGSAGQRRVPTEFLRTCPVLSPPLPEQQKIATILSSVDNVIETTREQIDKLKDLKTGMMQELLTKGIGPGGVPHTEFKDSPVGRIPVGWDVADLADYLAFISYGFTNPMPDAENGPFMITAKDVSDLRVQYDSARKTSIQAYNELLTEKSRPKLNDILLTKDGTLGRVALVEKANMCINQSVAVLRPNDKIIPKFLLYLLASPPYQREILDKAGGSTIKHIYITVVDKMKIAVPTKSEQEDVVKVLDGLFQKISLAEDKLRLYTDTKKALMQDLLTGKVRVKVDEPEKESVVA